MYMVNRFLTAAHHAPYMTDGGAVDISIHLPIGGRP